MPNERELFICPISQLVFKNPVLASDGYFYEKSYIKKWFKKSSKSPMTNLEINTELKKCYPFNSLLQLFLENNPEEKQNQFNNLKNHTEYISKVKTIIDNKSFDKLRKYINFSIAELLSNNLIKKLLESDKTEIIKYIIDNAIDLESTDAKGRRFMHYVCQYSPIEIVKYLVEKNVDLECTTNKMWRPIHYVCMYAEENIFNYLIENGVNLDSETKNKWRPILFICRYEKINFIEFMIRKCTDQLDSKINKYNGENVSYGIKHLILLNDMTDPDEKLSLLEIIRKEEENYKTSQQQ